MGAFEGDLVRRLRSADAHVVVQADDPAVSNIAGYVLASAVGVEPAVLEFREGGRDGLRSPPDWSGLVTPERHLVVNVPDAGPLGAGEGEWPLARADRAEDPMADLAEFLAHPEAAQHALQPQLPGPRPTLMLIANGGLVARRFPDDPIATGRLMEAQKRFQMAVLFASDGTSRRDYMAFDYGFRASVGSEPGDSIRLRCTRAPAAGDLRPGDEIPLEEFRGGTDALLRLRDAFGDRPFPVPLPTTKSSGPRRRTRVASDVSAAVV